MIQLRSLGRRQRDIERAFLGICEPSTQVHAKMPYVRKLIKHIRACIYENAYLGRVPLRKETVAALVEEIEKAMLAEGELERGPFSMRDLRRTAETHMAALGISSDVRAQIQSHGLGGIQARHYDRHDYLPEKRSALDQWAQRFTGDRKSVV